MVAMAAALLKPVCLPMASILSARPSVFCISNLIRLTASLVPKAFFSRSLSARVSISPNLPWIRSRISIMGNILPWESTKERPNSFCARPAPAKKALNLVPASDPLMVACSCPRIAICSAMPTPMDVASAPRETKAPDISEPVVLNICTATAV